MNENYKFTEEVKELLNFAIQKAIQYRHEILTPEHFLYAVLRDDYRELGELNLRSDLLDGKFCQLEIFLDWKLLEEKLTELYDNENLKNLSDAEFLEAVGGEIECSYQFEQMMEIAHLHAREWNEDGLIDTINILFAITQLENSWAQHILEQDLQEKYKEFCLLVANPQLLEERLKPFYDMLENAKIKQQQKEEENVLNQELICISKIYQTHNPLIGRDKELERTIQILCRKDKNNPLFIGESGVGKTSLVYGLAQRIAEGKVPQKLKNATIYEMSVGNMMSATQHRGDLEEKLKKVFDLLMKMPNPILFIDEVHTINGAGKIADGSLDMSNFMKPYFEAGHIRFIGATTYEEYAKYIQKDKPLSRRFQNIDINEPSVDEAYLILEGLQSVYESFHQVKIENEALRYAVEMGKKYINNSFLPDKAIDLIDEAGAYLQMNPTEGNVVTKQLVSTILAKICNVNTLSMEEDEVNLTRLSTLSERINSKIFGQNEAIEKVVEAVQLSKIGLSDDSKPLANFLFVGPTGVGKTEVCKTLASELSVPLLRFDMSEYQEEHSASKFIGSPAGYIGYEEGGILTNAIRKSPRCVLLLDEVEKAHRKIYDLLLQIMDYASLTDNKGMKADFRHVILIMTSNAGAQYASQSTVGFGSKVTVGEAMSKEVSRVFKPEFINRLSSVVIFNGMNHEMAQLILKRKVEELNDLTKKKGIVFSLTKKALQWLLQKGYSEKYGAREFDRVLHQNLKVLLMKKMMSGELKSGDCVKIDMVGDELTIKKQK
ncbi:MAG: AAA family ATPase [Paludibacteraceae bacterium]|nr:AAA family ATPase [Paludibacteraceae bacterium]